MKAHFFLLSITLFAMTQGFTQKKGETIHRIRHQFRSINTDSTLTIISIDAEEFLENAPDGGGELKGFYKEGTLVKIIEWIGLSLGNSIREFYFKNGELFFVYERFDSFVQTKEGLDKSRTTTSFEGRYYISGKKLVEEKFTGKFPLDKLKSTISSLEKDANEYRNKLSKTSGND